MNAPFLSVRDIHFRLSDPDKTTVWVDINGNTEAALTKDQIEQTILQFQAIYNQMRTPDEYADSII